MTLAEQLIQKGKYEGISQGRIEGLLEGKLEGKLEGIAEGELNMLICMLEAKFHVIPQEYLDPVSYTHLDVYKRQDKICRIMTMIIKVL